MIFKRNIENSSFQIISQRKWMSITARKPYVWLLAMHNRFQEKLFFKIPMCVAIGFHSPKGVGELYQATEKFLEKIRRHLLRIPTRRANGATRVPKTSVGVTVRNPAP